MKRETFFPALWAAALSFAAAIGTVGCVITAFDLPLADPRGWILTCAAASLLSTLCFSLRHGGWALGGVLIVSLGWLWQDGRLWNQTVQLLYRIGSLYDRAYGLGLLTASGETGVMADWPVAVLAALVSIPVCRCVCRGSRVWPGAAACTLPLLLCVVVTDTVPAETYLILWMAALILLILPGSVRQENPVQGLRLTAAAALPVLLFLLGLFLAIPQDSYVNRAEKLRTQIFQSVRSVPQRLETGVIRLTTGLRDGEPRQVDLRAVGPRPPFSYPVMEVTAGEGGLLYLRGQDYDVYDGLGWSASKDRRERFAIEGAAGDTLTIRTYGELDSRYLPYYTDAELTGGLTENPEKAQTYTLARTGLPADWRIRVYSGENTAEVPPEFERYLALPETTRQQAEALLEPLHLSGSHTAKADTIAALVTNSAAYDRNTAAMPREEPDFALWFLREADTGYCIHFATAATVLLRSAGVPARYVTGYLTEITDAAPKTVTEADAHAWAEYYEPILGCWLPLEATPGDPATEETLPGETLPEETLRPTLPPAQPEPSAPQTEPVELPTETAHMDATVATEPPPKTTPQPTPRGLFALLLVPLAAVTIVTQRALRLELRRNRQRNGAPNAQALARWREAVRVSRLMKDSPPEELVSLAQKAKFSNHQLSSEELQQFDAYIRTCHRQLKKRSFLHQCLYRYIYAIY